MTENLQNSAPETTRMRELISLLNRASEAYYGGEDEIISNYEWDSYFDELSSLENETGIVFDDSPTRNVGSQNASEAGSSDREEHEFPALSLAKTKSVDELKKWAGDRIIYLSYKLDGLTLVLTYDDGKLTRILTRGNGTVGNNITYLKDAIGSIPSDISYKGHMVVRGEAVISYTDFDMINALIEDEDERYANPRNLASGTLSLDDPSKVAERHVNFNAFTLVHIDDDIVNWGERMDFLKKEGFTTVEYVRCDASGIEGAIKEFTDKVENGKMDIPVDGLVICYEDTVYASSGSVTGHHMTRAGLAFKWADVSAATTLKYVEWSCAASTISPVAVFEPVMLEGTKVSRASLCNISEMERLNIREASTLHIIKANKIIPKCIRAEGGENDVIIPDKCPVCGEPSVIRESPRSLTKTLHCTNPKCAAKQGRKFERFVSKQGMDIDGLSIQTMLRFMNEHYITDFADIFHLKDHAESIRTLDGFGDRSCENILNAIERSRKTKASAFIFSLCIPMIGIDAAKKLIRSLSFDGFLSRLKDGSGFEDVDGIGIERSGQIIKWYSDPENASLLDKLLSEVELTETESSSSEGGRCSGLNFVITGDVHHFKNRDEFKLYVEKEGGRVSGSVSNKTSFLINNDVSSGSSKNRKAKELKVPIISEDEFVERFCL